MGKKEEDTRVVDKQLFLDHVDKALAFVTGELLKFKPRWCPSRIWLWWTLRRTKKLMKQEVEVN